MHRSGDCLSGPPKRQFHKKIISQIEANIQNAFPAPPVLHAAAAEQKHWHFLAPIQLHRKTGALSVFQGTPS
jgi:hypothetical protein